MKHGENPSHATVLESNLPHKLGHLLAKALVKWAIARYDALHQASSFGGEPEPLCWVLGWGDAREIVRVQRQLVVLRLHVLAGDVPSQLGLTF